MASLTCDRPGQGPFQNPTSLREWVARDMTPRTTTHQRWPSGASKSALIGMSRAMAREVGGDGITVNAVLPGMIETEIENRGRTDDGRQHVIGMQSLKRQQTPEDMVGTLLFLASPASGFMTGQSICVDGGAAFV